jgi:transcriptional regulator with XRE-family HTH domain
MEHDRAAYELAIAQVLKTLHEEHGFSRTALAEVLEVTDLAVTRFERGAEPLSAGALMVLLKLHDLSWQEFEERVNAELPSARSRIERAAHGKSTST